MKTNLITLAALCALILSPAFGAPKKTNTSSSKTVPAKAAPAKEDKDKISSKQAGARELVSDLTTTQKSKMLILLNEGSPEELSVIRGVSKTRAAAIEKARPFKTVDQVILVSGIGKGTFAEMIGHARGLTVKTKKAAPSASASSKKTSKKS